MIKKLFTLLFLVSAYTSNCLALQWYDGTKAVDYTFKSNVSPVVLTAAEMFCSDMEMVTGRQAEQSKDGVIQIFQLDKDTKATRFLSKTGCPVKEVSSNLDAFWIGVSKGKILIAGNNGRGCAYGLLELSRMAGVSPWVWWGDVTPEKKSSLSVDDSFKTLQIPSVEYRGIFINDEDWSLRNWAWRTFEKSDKFGTIGPKTYKEIFKLLLRLRGNMIWPGMHSGTPGFFTVKGNKEAADSCGILIGSSHCEPLLRNNVAEWDAKKRGAYNYITNKESVQNYWIERLKEVAGSEEFFTIGMRGIHDGSMEGVKTAEEKLKGLQMVIDDQRRMLAKYINPDVTKIPQVFIPYKEVLEIMESGLKVPEDVTLMWCDDNYGYMTRLSDSEQQKRQGGGGVYYHLSYWGRPHDYLWLTTTQPGLIYSEMKAAYDHNSRKLWIVNVHDPKVAAYDLQFFLDMAWDINSVGPNKIEQHLGNWLITQFGTAAGTRLTPVMKEFYRLCAIRRPEFMGWTQTELDKRVYPRGLSRVTDTEFSTSEFGNELQRYQNDYANICKTVSEIKKTIPSHLQDAFFACIEYPVFSSAAMASKMLEAQKARASMVPSDKPTDSQWAAMTEASARSVSSYREIQRLTDYYNNILANGKWKGLMTMNPRDLYVFYPPTVPYMPKESVSIDLTQAGPSTPLIQSPDFVARNASQFDISSTDITPVQMLGHSMNAVPLPKGESLTYQFKTELEGDAILYTAMIPTQPNDKGDLRYSVRIDEMEPVVISLKEKYRSEFWKKSVLRCQALKTTPVHLSKGGHTLTVTALDDHIIFDQWMVDFKLKRQFYMIPAL